MFDHFDTTVQCEELTFSGWETASPEDIEDMNTWLDEVEQKNNDRRLASDGMKFGEWDIPTKVGTKVEWNKW